MDVFKTVSPFTTVVFLVCAAWPLNLPLLALAVRVRQGTGPSDYDDAGELWWRSALGSVGVAGIAWLLLGVMYGLIVGMDFHAAAGVVQLALLIGLGAAVAGYLFWALALDEFVHGLAVFGLFVLIPGLPLALLGWLFGLGKPLAAAFPWLLSP